MRAGAYIAPHMLPSLLALPRHQVWNEKESLPTGYGAATLAEWAAAQGE